jgi:sulfur-carrier protein adenylyltransferase/sulfurtransferase
MRVIEQILDLARWAPSGDNTQPWRFEIVSDDQIAVHGFDTRDHCVYDLDGRASQLSIGAMLETMRIASSGFGRSASVSRRANSPEAEPVFDVLFRRDPALQPNPLLPFITTRSVQRRPFSTRPLRGAEKQALEESVGDGYEVIWLEDLSRRWQVARLVSCSARLRLTIKEAYELHASVIEWRAKFSETKIPDKAIGLDPVTLHLMRWAMKNWSRTRILSKYLGGTLVPRLELEVIPALACAAHVLLLAKEPRSGIDQQLVAGAAVQRFWLTAEALGLRHQPEITPLVFARYAREGVRFSADPGSSRQAAEVDRRLTILLGPTQSPRAVWMGRIGRAHRAVSRSLRIPLQSLLVTGRRQ